jgi:hypothetical protein
VPQLETLSRVVLPSYIHSCPRSPSLSTGAAHDHLPPALNAGNPPLTQSHLHISYCCAALSLGRLRSSRRRAHRGKKRHTRTTQRTHCRCTLGTRPGICNETARSPSKTTLSVAHIPACPPLAVHRLLRQVQTQIPSSTSSSSEYKAGIHGVIDVGQLPSSSALLLPAAHRPAAAVCEPA